MSTGQDLAPRIPGRLEPYGTPWMSRQTWPAKTYRPVKSRIYILRFSKYPIGCHRIMYAYVSYVSQGQWLDDIYIYIQIHVCRIMKYDKINMSLVLCSVHLGRNMVYEMKCSKVQIAERVMSYTIIHLIINIYREKWIHYDPRWNIFMDKSQLWLSGLIFLFIINFTVFKTILSRSPYFLHATRKLWYVQNVVAISWPGRVNYSEDTFPTNLTRDGKWVSGRGSGMTPQDIKSQA